MMRIMLKSKVHYATITDLHLYYKGSISIDEDILRAANLKVGERVDVLNLNNGNRLQTYVIKGEKASGKVCLNGPAARCGIKGDKLIIIAYGFYKEEELEQLKANYVELDEANKIKTSYMA